MGNARSKKISDGTRLILFVSIIIAIVFGITVLPVVRFNDTAIRLFAPERLEFSGRGFDGRVFGTHVLETDHGEITLNNFARVFSDDNTIIMIYSDSFANGRATHNLVVEGMKIPQNIGITFSRHMSHQIARLQLYDQEIVLSNIPLDVREINLEHPSHIVCIVMNVTNIPAYIELSDFTQLHHYDFYNWLFLGSLRIYRDAGLWELLNVHSGIPVSFPDEAELVRYRAITFGENWGAFIEGELFE